MKNKIKFLGIIAITVVIGFSMAACDFLGGENGDGNDGGYKAPQRGLLTISNLPAGWVILTCYINSNENYQFYLHSDGNAVFSDSDDWHMNLIGAGSKMENNKVELVAVKYNLDENGDWVLDNDSSKSDFNYTGAASVFLHFKEKPAGVDIYFFVENNVTFTNGNATIDFTTIYNP